MERKKIVWMLLTALVISLVIIAGSLAMAKRQEKGMAHHEAPAETSTVPSGYVLKITDGQIGLFRAGSSAPYQRLDMPISLLSEYDKEQLEAGIPVETEAELRQLVEDLTS